MATVEGDLRERGWKEALARQGVSGGTIPEDYLAFIKILLAWDAENRKSFARSPVSTRSRLAANRSG